MKKNTFLKLVISIFFTNFIIAQSNEYPTLGDVTVRSYSPLMILQRSENIGGFISGVQTKLLDGTNNWYFGNLHSDSWIVSKGDYQNPKLTILSNGKVGIGTMNPLSKLNSTNNYYSGTPTKEISAAFFDNQGIGVYIGGNEYNYGYIQAEQTDNTTLKPLVLQPNGSNVGIGTGSPNAKLTINASANSNDNAILLYNNNTAADSYTAIGSYYANGNTNVNSQIRFGNEQSNSAPSYLAFATGSGSAAERMRITSNGNVGIGTANPTQKLDVNGNAIFQGKIITSTSGVLGGEIQINNPSKTANGTARSWSIFNMTGGYGNSLQFWAYDNLGCVDGGMCANRFTIMDNGNVGVGILNPTNKLDVNGTIHSKEVKVDMNGWSDFVFKKEYNLPTLEEVEKQIIEKGHLKNIPNEDEVLKNGINLGEMNAKLLQKIEEMTLYMIEQNKSIENLKEEIKNIKSKM